LGSKSGGKSGTRAPEHTFEETKYLKQLIEKGTSVRVRLSNNEEVRGVVEYYDASFIRITRAGQPNLSSVPLSWRSQLWPMLFIKRLSLVNIAYLIFHWVLTAR